MKKLKGLGSVGSVISMAMTGLCARGECRSNHFSFVSRAKVRKMRGGSVLVSCKPTSSTGVGKCLKFTLRPGLDASCCPVRGTLSLGDGRFAMGGCLFATLETADGMDFCRNLASGYIG